jgi:DNA topoisomerase IB
MSMTGPEVLDETVQTTNIWLKEVRGPLAPDRKRAYRARWVVLPPNARKVWAESTGSGVRQ